MGWLIPIIGILLMLLGPRLLRRRCPLCGKRRMWYYTGYFIPRWRLPWPSYSLWVCDPCQAVFKRRKGKMIHQKSMTPPKGCDLL